MKYKARRGLIPVQLMHPTLVTDRKVPPGLSATVEAVEWKQIGDHAAVIPNPDPLCKLADCNEIVVVKDGKVALHKGEPPVPSPDMGQGPMPDGTRFKQLRPIPGIVRREDEQGYTHDYIVLPGFYVITNDSDGIVWALDPYKFRAWFEEIKGE